jgi:hypothetical protein
MNNLGPVLHILDDCFGAERTPRMSLAYLSWRISTQIPVRYEEG